MDAASKRKLRMKWEKLMQAEVPDTYEDVFTKDCYIRSSAEREYFLTYFSFFNKLGPFIKENDSNRIFRLLDLVKSKSKINNQCPAEFALTRNLSLQNICFMFLHKNLKLVKHSKVDSFLENYVFQPEMINMLCLPIHLKDKLQLIYVNCGRHRDLIIERPMYRAKRLKYCIRKNTAAYDNIILKYGLHHSNLCNFLYKSTEMIEAIDKLIGNLRLSAALFFDNMFTMQIFCFEKE